ncbi:MAG: MFS transporter [Actinobacteria bacterium]|nr:MFS transporter [Actinomycetota bacterium]
MYSSNDLIAIQKKTLRTLVSGQVIAAASLASAVTVGAYVIQNILGADTAWSGIASATVTIGTAFMAQILSLVMMRKGRRVGLQSGYLAAFVGGVIAGVGAEKSHLVIFLVGLFLFGNGQASNLLSRYAATDLADVKTRASAMSRILFASTFGAVFGPILVVPAERVGESVFGWHKYTGPWIFSACFFVFAAINVMVRLRPDPLEVSGGLKSQNVAGVQPPKFRIAMQAIIQSPSAKIAIFAMVVSQVTMVAVMTMTPVHLKAHGHEGVSPFVISLHIAGMYAFSPWVGKYCDRKGRYSAIAVGSILLISATVFAALAGESALLLFPALWLLGVGWSFGLIGGSNLLVDSVPLESRVQVQGTADFLMSLCGGIAGFSSGFIRRAVGFHMLSNIACLLAFVMFLVVQKAQRNRAASSVSAL